MSYSANYYRKLIEGYQAFGKEVSQEVWDNLREAEERELKGQEVEAFRQAEFHNQELERIKKLQEEFYVFDDNGWPVKGRRANWRGAHTLRALAIFSGRDVMSCHEELLALFRNVNRNRQKATKKFMREEQELHERSEIPNWLVRDWCEAEGLECTFSKPFGEPGLLLRPGVVPDDGLLLLTKDWVAMKGGKIVASWNPLWHDHRAVNGVWVRS